MSPLRSILLVEDDVVDHMLVERALHELAFGGELEIAADAESALAGLRDAQRPLPDIILLDINMPRLSGLEFLEVIKRDAALQMIPVIVLTTSREDQDKRASFKSGAAGYIVKPVDYARFVEAMTVVRDYWTLSERPS